MTTAAEQCGAPAEGGPCVLPRGHNMGQADVLDNHHWEPQSTGQTDVMQLALQERNASLLEQLRQAQRERDAWHEHYDRAIAENVEDISESRGQIEGLRAIIASAIAVQGAERADQWRGSLMQSILSQAEVPDLAPQEITEDLVRKVAAAIIKRATWPSLHWPSIVGVQSVDVAMALARAALEAIGGPEDANLLGTLARLAVKAEKDKETER